MPISCRRYLMGLILETRGLSKVYSGTVRAVDSVNLAVQEGEFLAVMGPSGSGKTTLLNLLGAMDRPTAGEVYVEGESLARIRDLDRFRARTLGFVFQMHNLLPTLTAQENVELPMRAGTLPRRQRREQAEVLLGMVGLAERAGHRPPQLSGGERQRVAIARALANQPRLILADEPTGNLDSASGAEVMATFRRLNLERGTAVIVVTHDRAVAHATDRIVRLHDGRIVGDELVGDPYLRDLREFKVSALGQALLEGQVPPTVQDLGLESLLPGMQSTLARV
jgi:ABC-type lipoprotein export system ATPase subunit